MLNEKQEARFWSWVRLGDEEDCWLWIGTLHNKGYGLFGVDGRIQRCHRIAYELENGPIPDGMLVCHSCDNRDCVNPAHLWLGTAQDNTTDMVRKGRHGGVRFDSEMVRWIRKVHVFGSAEWGVNGLSRKIGCSQNAVWRVVKRSTWKHV